MLHYSMICVPAIFDLNGVRTDLTDLTDLLLFMKRQFAEKYPIDVDVSSVTWDWSYKDFTAYI